MGSFAPPSPPQVDPAPKPQGGPVWRRQQQARQQRRVQRTPGQGNVINAPQPAPPPKPPMGYPGPGGVSGGGGFGGGKLPPPPVGAGGEEGGFTGGNDVLRQKALAMQQAGVPLPPWAQQILNLSPASQGVPPIASPQAPLGRTSPSSPPGAPPPLMGGIPRGGIMGGVANRPMGSRLGPQGDGSVFGNPFGGFGG